MTALAFERAYRRRASFDRRRGVERAWLLGSSGGGFTLHRAGHDALRVLVVAAGVLLIALAVAIPLGLVSALVAWLWLRLRRHRRESALDGA